MQGVAVLPSGGGVKRLFDEEGGLMQGVAVPPSGGGVRRLFDEEGGLMQGVTVLKGQRSKRSVQHEQVPLWAVCSHRTASI